MNDKINSYLKRFKVCVIFIFVLITTSGFLFFGWTFLSFFSVSAAKMWSVMSNISLGIILSTLIPTLLFMYNKQTYDELKEKELEFMDSSDGAGI